MDGIQFKQQESEPGQQELSPNGLLLQQTSDKAAEEIINLHREAFSKGVLKYYRDARATPPKNLSGPISMVQRIWSDWICQWLNIP